MTGQTIVCFSSIDWDDNWQVHQEVTSALARAGNTVIFVETTGVRQPRLADLPRLVNRFRKWRSRAPARALPGNIRVVSPVLLPFPYSRLVLPLNRFALRRMLRRAMSGLENARPIVWTFLPTPLVASVARSLEPRLTIYHRADDFSTSSAEASRITPSEEEMLRRADLVIATSHQLAEGARRFNSDVHLVPAGVAFDRFEQARLDDRPPPADLQALPRPIVGFVGSVNQRVDTGLLAEVARQLPSFSFALIGPVSGSMPALAERPNIHLFGQRSHGEVPYYIKGFDVGIIPYRVTAYTNHIYPVKLNEYLAMGVPVVSTSLEESRHFVDRHGDVIAVACGAPAFVTAIQSAVRESADPERRRTRIAVACLNSWANRFEAIGQAVGDKLS